MTYQYEQTITTHGRGLYEMTDRIADICKDTALTGVCHIFIQHTSASLLITENADSQVLSDMERFFHKLVPDGSNLFQHNAEGADDMPAHVRSALTQTSLTLPLNKGHLQLGTWQGVYIWEHRYRGRRRRLTVTLLGESLKPKSNH